MELSTSTARGGDEGYATPLPASRLLLPVSDALGAAEDEVCLSSNGASPRNFANVKRLGAREAFDYRSKTVISDIVSASRGREIAGALAIGVGSAAACIAIVGACKGARFVAMAPPPPSFDDVPAGRCRLRRLAPAIALMIAGSIRFVPFFDLHANRTIAQIRRAGGFVAGAVQRDAQLVFWTMTVGRDERAMRAYRASGAHRKATPHLADWADEASVGRWRQPGGDLPEWPEAVRRLREEGLPLTLRHPAPNRPEQRFAEPQTTYGMRF